MGRILAIDYGLKRVGLAVTDPLKIVPGVLDTIHSSKVLEYIKDYVSKEDVETIVIGMPVGLDGKDTHSTQHVRGFYRKLKKEFPDIPVHQIDERYTSKMAESAMLQAGLTKKVRFTKENIDKVSAVIILQSFLEKLSYGRV